MGPEGVGRPGPGMLVPICGSAAVNAADAAGPACCSPPWFPLPRLSRLLPFLSEAIALHIQQQLFQRNGAYSQAGALGLLTQLSPPAQLEPDSRQTMPLLRSKHIRMDSQPERDLSTDRVGNPLVIGLPE